MPYLLAPTRLMHISRTTSRPNGQRAKGGGRIRTHSHHPRFAARWVDPDDVPAAREAASSAYWLRGAQRFPRYVAIGAGAQLYPVLGRLSGWRGVVEGACLGMPHPWHWAGPVASAPILAALAALGAVVGHIDDALLLWTGYYKETALVGIVAYGGDRRFVKVFVDGATAASEERRVAQLRALVDGFAEVAPVRCCEGPVVVYDLLARGRRHLTRPALHRLALDLGAAALRRDGRLEVVDDPQDTARVLPTLRDPVLPVASDAYRRAVGLRLQVPMALSHGDLIASNVFRGEHGEVCLVDYERVGRRPAFHDAFHLALARPGRWERRTELAPVIAAVADRAGISRTAASRLAAANLVEEIATSVDYHRRYPGNRARSSRMIEDRGRALAEVLAAL